MGDLVLALEWLYPTGLIWHVRQLTAPGALEKFSGPQAKIRLLSRERLSWPRRQGPLLLSTSGLGDAAEQRLGTSVTHGAARPRITRPKRPFRIASQRQIARSAVNCRCRERHLRTPPHWNRRSGARGRRPCHPHR